MINIDSKILDALKSSTCFGIAHDLTTPECKMCDVQQQCRTKKEGDPSILPPPKVKKVAQEQPPKATPPKDTTKPAASSAPKNTQKPSSNTKPAGKTQAKPVASGDMPDFKPMDLPSLKELAKSRNVEWKDYESDSITRMRLIMALKASY